MRYNYNVYCKVHLITPQPAKSSKRKLYQKVVISINHINFGEIPFYICYDIATRKSEKTRNSRTIFACDIRLSNKDIFISRF